MSDEIDKFVGVRLTRRELLKRAGVGAGVLMVPGLVGACGGGSGTTTTAGATTSTAGATTTTVATAGTIKVGFVSPRTGPAAGFGQADGYILDLVRSKLASGLEVGGKTYAVEIIDRDGQTNPAVGASVAQELINSDRVDLMLATSTPETVNPVADASEAAGVPCMSAVTPWESWYFGRGAKPGEPSPFKWTYHMSAGVTLLADAYLSLWSQLETNKKVGVMFANDADGNAMRAGFAPMLEKGGYTIVDPGPYQNGSNDYSFLIAEFKAEGCEVFTGLPQSPDFATFWRQAVQQGYKPKIAQIGKACQFAAELEALGSIGVGLASVFYWSPVYPYASPVTNLTSQELANGYEEATGKQWFSQVGATLSLLDAGIEALKASGNPLDKAAVAEAMKTLKVEVPIGKLEWGKQVRCRTWLYTP
ncbi:MAG: ABC transporter substrate-binding protein [Thermoleophilia bacterium]|nr:ABC transporter substrate-binding protein [Thermoleophilia bacterium]